MSKLREIVTAKNLCSLAGGLSYSRGEEYFESGLVGPVTERDGTICAKVRGSYTYEVRLKAVPAEKGKARLDHACTCPVGRDGDFCKHCVALGLAWIEKISELAGDESISSTGSKPVNKPITQADIRKWLEAQEPKHILDILMEQIKSDGRLHEDLTLKIARENARGIDMTTYRSGIRSAFHTGGFVDYYEMGDYAAGMDEEIAKIERLFKEGFAEETVNLCEYALERAAQAIGDVDDSDGNFWYIAERLQSLHLEACKKAKPDPVMLAKRLFTFETAGDDLEIFSGCAQAYKNILGKAGLAEYRKLADAEWAKVPAKVKGDPCVYGRRLAITRIMETLARAEGDIDGLIAIKKRDLSSALRYLDIAGIFRDAKRYDEALEWAEKGLLSFKDNPHNGLREFLAEEYHRRKRYNDAYGLYRIQYIEQPRLEYYKKFTGYAKKVKREEGARSEALEWLRREIEKEKESPKQHYWHAKPDHSRLVEIFLWEKDVEAAWREAKAGGCRYELWLELAKLREKDHPADSVDVYKRLVEPIIDRKKNDAYAEAVRMIGKIRELMGRIGKKEEFAAYLANLRLRHKPKRNLMKLLEKF